MSKTDTQELILPTKTAFEATIELSANNPEEVYVCQSNDADNVLALGRIVYQNYRYREFFQNGIDAPSVGEEFDPCNPDSVREALAMYPEQLANYENGEWVVVETPGGRALLDIYTSRASHFLGIKDGKPLGTMRLIQNTLDFPAPSIKAPQEEVPFTPEAREYITYNEIPELSFVAGAARGLGIFKTLPHIVRAMMEYAQQTGQLVWMGSIDNDFLKQIKDEFGYEIDDTVGELAEYKGSACQPLIARPVTAADKIPFQIPLMIRSIQNTFESGNAQNPIGIEYIKKMKRRIALQKTVYEVHKQEALPVEIPEYILN